MVFCDYEVGLTFPCGNNEPTAGVILYPKLLKVKDNELIKLQIVTGGYPCDLNDQIPTEYCLDWGDNSTNSSGAFVSGKAANIELSHTYRHVLSDSESTVYYPKVTIQTKCGGIRTVGNSQDVCAIYVYNSTTGVPAGNEQYSMSAYSLHPDFNSTACGLGTRFQSCYGDEQKCSDNYINVCNDGEWEITKTFCGDINETWIPGQIYVEPLPYVPTPDPTVNPIPAPTTVISPIQTTQPEESTNMLLIGGGIVLVGILGVAVYIIKNKETKS